MNKSAQTSHSKSRIGEDLDLWSIIGALVSHRWLIAITTVVIVLLGAAYAFLSTPVYSSSILFKVEDSNGVASSSDNRDLLRSVSSLFDEKASAEAEMQVVASKAIAAGTVDALKLYIEARPHYMPLIGGFFARHSDDLSTPGLFGYGNYAWGTESIQVSDFDVPERMNGAAYSLTADGDGKYTLTGRGLDAPVHGRVGVTEQFPTSEGNITLHVDKINGLPGVGFAVTHRSRQDTITDLQKHLLISEQGAKSGVFKVSLDGTDPVRLSKTINMVGQQYVQLNGARKTAIADNSLEFLESRLPEAKAQMEASEHAYNDYRDQHAMLDLSEQGKLMLQQSVTANGQLLDLERKRQELSALYAPNHPQVLALTQQIASTKKFIGDLTDRTKALPSEEQGALGLARDVRVNTDLYTAMRKNVDELRLIKAGKVSSVQWIDQADVPERPVKPAKAMILLIAGVIGLLFGSALALLRDFLFRGVTDPHELEVGTGLAVFATIPLSARQRELEARIGSSVPGQNVLAAHHPKDPTVESLRMLRSSLQFAMTGARNNIVMLGGPLPGIGKSFVSVNLATMMAAGGKRVLLVDSDLRRGRLNAYFDLPRGPGLADILDGTGSLEKSLHKEVMPNLDFISTGAYPGNPAELLLRDGFKSLMDEVSGNYDIVLLDAPAVLAVSDAGIIAPVAGSVFLVARYGDTRTQDINESVRRFEQIGTSVNGVLLNGYEANAMGYSSIGRYGNYSYVAHGYESNE
ncbi:polysaccharide biosynthesis tyrosine autokinase [Caballeronia sp. BR00000012568055]|uniref:polysaccharide biosynthesis tyrosine autokinase n=1 Tax=Caballeronia sp. BR00000012568055 TaxID=2918761 RepID=UPI0023F66A78|nr:polysaccharide biosynthesis tyrosine autokinase [Caballeronia sp. BR00000012568055]